MWDKIREFFKRAWKWIEAVWEKHDDMLQEMVAALLPMVVNVAFRSDLSGEEKKKAIIDAILDNAEVAAEEISTSMLNEAIEIAAARYNIQLGKLTIERMDASREAALKAARDFSNKKLEITGREAEDVGITAASILSNEDGE